MTKYRLEPTGNRVALAPIQDEMVTKGGIVLPDVAARRPARGKVVALGPDCTTYRIGDIGLFPRYAGVEVEVDQDIYIILAEHELLARVYPEENVLS